MKIRILDDFRWNYILSYPNFNNWSLLLTLSGACNFEFRHRNFCLMFWGPHEALGWHHKHTTFLRFSFWVSYIVGLVLWDDPLILLRRHGGHRVGPRHLRHLGSMAMHCGHLRLDKSCKHLLLELLGLHSGVLKLWLLAGLWHGVVNVHVKISRRLATVPILLTCCFWLNLLSTILCLQK